VKTDEKAEADVTKVAENNENKSNEVVEKTAEESKQ